MSIPGGWELVLLFLVFMVLFGAKRLPEMARNLGQSMRILRTEVAEEIAPEDRSEQWKR